MFVNLYFVFIVMIGHFYMMQLLLAVIMQNLAKIQTIEAVKKIAKKRLLVREDRRLRNEKLRIIKELQASEDLGEDNRLAHDAIN